MTLLSLETAEEKIHSIFNTCFPSEDVGVLAVEGQRSFISGFIFCLLDSGQIEKIVHDILHAMFFEGMSRETAIEMLGGESQTIDSTEDLREIA